MNTVYIITLITVMIISIIGTIENKNQNKPKKIFLYIIIFILVIISGIRDLTYIHGDEYAYRIDFDDIVINGTKTAAESKDIGFWLINYILSIFTHENQILIFAMALLTNVIIILNLYKQSKYFNFSLFLYIALGMYFSSFNIMRQYLAVAIAFSGMNYIYSREKKKYISCIVFASLMHFSAIVLLPMYWLVKARNKKKIYITISIVGIIFFLLSSKMMTLLSGIERLNSYYDMYSNQDLSVGIIRVLVIAIPVILLGTQYRKLVEKDEKFEMLYMYSYISMVIMICSTKFLYISRLYEYFGIINLLLIPEVLAIIKKQGTRLFVTVLIGALFFTFGFIDSSKHLYEYRTYFDQVIKAIKI